MPEKRVRPQIKADSVIAVLMTLGVLTTVAVAAFATKNATGFRPDPHAWFLTLIVPGLLLLGVTAYYNERRPY
jgi:hypothetical protein